MGWSSSHCSATGASLSSPLLPPPRERRATARVRCAGATHRFVRAAVVGASEGRGMQHMLIYSHQGSARMAAALPHVTCNGGLSTAILHFIVLPNSPSSTLRELPCMPLARCYATSCTSWWAVSGGKRGACGAVQGDSRSQKRCAQGVQHLRFCRAHAGRTNVAWC